MRSPIEPIMLSQTYSGRAFDARSVPKLNCVQVLTRPRPDVCIEDACHIYWSIYLLEAISIGSYNE